MPFGLARDWFEYAFGQLLASFALTVSSDGLLHAHKEVDKAGAKDACRLGTGAKGSCITNAEIQLSDGNADSTSSVQAIRPPDVLSCRALVQMVAEMLVYRPACLDTNLLACGSSMPPPHPPFSPPLPPKCPSHLFEVTLTATHLHGAWSPGPLAWPWPLHFCPMRI